MVPTGGRSRNRQPCANRRPSIQSAAMRLARELEKRLERLVDGLSAAIFRGRIHPVDIADRLLREVDLQHTEGPAGPEIPNRWTLGISATDATTVDEGDLAAELTHVLEATAAERGWRTGGPITVAVRVDAGTKPGSVRCTGSVEPGETPPWSILLDVAGGRAYDIADNRVVIGRAEAADVRIDHPEVSRRHAVLFRSAGRAWIQDAGSANGTKVNGRPVPANAVLLRPGDDVSLGPATFSFRMS